MNAINKAYERAMSMRGSRAARHRDRRQLQGSEKRSHAASPRPVQRSSSTMWSAMSKRRLWSMTSPKAVATRSPCAPM